jgi:hypothetical protein
MSTKNEVPTPHPDLQAFERLIGTWEVSGGAAGRIRYEWLPGKFFLMQHFDFDHGGHRVNGIEIIGHLQRFGEAPSRDIHARIYDSVGNTFDYVYELEGETLTIWGGERGSPAYYQGRFSSDGDTLSGAWVYPGGGGYSSKAVRVKD